MKHTVMLLLILALMLASACTGGEHGTASRTVSGTVASSKAGPASSDASSAAAAVIPDGYCDVDAAVKAAGLSANTDISSCFRKDAKGYVIHGGTAEKPYLVNADTLRRLAVTPCQGTGYVKWVLFNKSTNVASNEDPFDGIIPASKLNDPIFMAACLPSEVTTSMTYRVNPGNHYPVTDKQNRILTIGAIYRNENDKPADDAPVTLCLSHFTILLHSAKTGWFTAEQLAVPSVNMVRQMYYLPWSLQRELGAYKIPTDDISPCEDHIEIELTGARFNGTAFSDERIEELCLHFWGNEQFFSHFNLTGGEIDGVVIAYRAWVKEPDMAGKFSATIGADIKSKDGKDDHQVFSGFNYKLTTEPRWILGHNVGPKAYDAVMDSEKVQQLIGLK